MELKKILDYIIDKGLKTVLEDFKDAADQVELLYLGVQVPWWMLDPEKMVRNGAIVGDDEAPDEGRDEWFYDTLIWPAWIHFCFGICFYIIILTKFHFPLWLACSVCLGGLTWFIYLVILYVFGLTFFIYYSFYWVSG